MLLSLPFNAGQYSWILANCNQQRSEARAGKTEGCLCGSNVSIGFS